MKRCNPIIAMCGIPLAVVFLALERLLGIKPKSEGFSDLARFIGISFYCGIGTIFAIVTLIYLLAV